MDQGETRMGESVRNKFSLAIAAGTAVAVMALAGCASDEVSAQSGTRPEAETTTTAAPTTAAPTTAAPTTAAPTTAPPTTAPPTTAAPAAAEPPPLVYPDGTTQSVSLDKYEVTAGDMLTASVSGFAPGSPLSHGFVGVWPPSGVPDEDHIPTYMPDVAVADGSGAATLQIEVPEICGKGDCFIAVMDGIGYEALYAARQLTYVG
ncbi:MAG: hypothetical protein ACR2OH_02345 [Microthrixaceae bacterium]